MCFDLDSRPPIAPIAGGSLDQASLVLTGDDGNRFLAFRARATEPSGAGIVILPDVRGLHPYYEELALRFAEAGIDAVAFDYFGRSAGIDTPRDDSFEYQPHVEQTTWAGIAADVRAAAAEVRADGDRVGSLFTIGFCMGGRAAFVTPTLGLGLAGAIGFYGSPTARTGEHPADPRRGRPEMEGAVLGLFGGRRHRHPAGGHRHVRRRADRGRRRPPARHLRRRAAQLLRPQGRRLRRGERRGLGRGPRVHPGADRESRRPGSDRAAGHLAAEAERRDRQQADRERHRARRAAAGS